MSTKEKINQLALPIDKSVEEIFDCLDCLKIAEDEKKYQEEEFYHEWMILQEERELQEYLIH